MLQLLFQAQIHLRLHLKDRILKLECIWKCPIHFEIQTFLHFLHSNLKIFEHKNWFIFKTLQLWLWTKVHLNNGLKFIFKTCWLQLKDNLTFKNCDLKNSSFHVPNLIFSLWLHLDFGLSWRWWYANAISYANLHHFRNYLSFLSCFQMHTDTHTHINVFDSIFLGWLCMMSGLISLA